MAKYVYPAIFTHEENGQYSVTFPDVEGCYTGGDDLADAIEMAEDALALMLFHFEQEKHPIPASSDLADIAAEDGSFVSLIACDTLGYQKRNNTKAVKKTLSIPEWMNEAATAAGVNFSQVLQEALAEKLDLG